MAVKKLYRDNLVAGAAIRDDKGHIISKKYHIKGKLIKVNPEYEYPIVHKAIPNMPRIGTCYYFNGYPCIKVPIERRNEFKTIFNDIEDYRFIRGINCMISDNRPVSIKITKDLLKKNNTIDYEKLANAIRCGHINIIYSKTSSDNFIIENNKVICIAKPNDDRLHDNNLVIGTFDKNYSKGYTCVWRRSSQKTIKKYVKNKIGCKYIRVYAHVRNRARFTKGYQSIYYTQYAFVNIVNGNGMYRKKE